MKLRAGRAPQRARRISWLIPSMLLMATFLSFLIFVPTTAVHGDAVGSTIQVGNSPYGVAVNPSTDRIFVANHGDGTISVIEGTSNTVAGTITVGGIPADVGVNSVTNRVYVTHSDSSVVTVVDASTGRVVTTISVQQNPRAIAVNPITNTIYLAGSGSSGSAPPGTLSVISGTNDTVLRTIAVGSGPFSIAVNPSTNRVYVANFYDWTISVIDGSTSSPLSTVQVSGSPDGLAVNPRTNRLYVNDATHNSLLVLDASTFSILAQVPVGSFPNAVDLNPNTNKVYVVNSIGGTVSIVDGDANAVVFTLKVGNFPPRVAVNSASNLVYVTNHNSNTVSVIRGGLTTTSRLTVATQNPSGAPLTGLYVVLYQGGRSVATGFSPASFRVNNSQPYTLVVHDYGNYSFANWLDTGSTNRFRAITLTANTTVTAVYSNSSSPPPGSSFISVSTVNSAGTALTGYSASLWQNGVFIRQCFSPCSFTVSNGQTYQVAVADSGGETFSHWTDGTTSRLHTVVAGTTSTTVKLTAVYTP